MTTPGLVGSTPDRGKRNVANVRTRRFLTQNTLISVAFSVGGECACPVVRVTYCNRFTGFTSHIT